MESSERLRQDAQRIFSAAVKAVDPRAAVERMLRVSAAAIHVGDRGYPFAGLGKIYVVGAGKASAPMAEAIEALLGDRLAGGIVITKYGHANRLEKIRIIEAGHPIPDQAGVEGARQIAAMVRSARDEDLIILLLSGGGSALLPYPIDGITLADKQTVTRLLLRSGATIRELNTMRRHLSQIKGGRLAQLAFPAQVISLILSDVVGDSLEDIASGPTAPDPSRYADCGEIIGRYNLHDKLSLTIRETLRRGANGSIPDTPKAGDPMFAKVQNIIVGSNRIALEAARGYAETLGYHTLISSCVIDGECRVVAKAQAAMIKEMLGSKLPVSRPACVISGGETTVTVRGDGVGGRNQEFALAAASELDGVAGVVLLSAGTDGTDGPTDAAGAVIDGDTVRRGAALGLAAGEFLDRNDSYNFFRRTGELLMTGPTLTNVMDLQIILID